MVTLSVEEYDKLRKGSEEAAVLKEKQGGITAKNKRKRVLRKQRRAESAPSESETASRTADSEVADQVARGTGHGRAGGAGRSSTTCLPGQLPIVLMLESGSWTQPLSCACQQEEEEAAAVEDDVEEVVDQCEGDDTQQDRRGGRRQPQRAEAGVRHIAPWCHQYGG